MWLVTGQGDNISWEEEFFKTKEEAVTALNNIVKEIERIYGVKPRIRKNKDAVIVRYIENDGYEYWYLDKADTDKVGKTKPLG